MTAAEGGTLYWTDLERQRDEVGKQDFDVINTRPKQQKREER